MAHLALLANPESGSGEAGDVERLLREHGRALGWTSPIVDGEGVEAEDVRFTVEPDAYRVVVG